MTQIKPVNPKTLYSWLNNDKVILIDVREQSEYKEFCIKDAINIPLSKLLNEAGLIPDIKDKKLVLYCRVGVRSMCGCQLLAKEGTLEEKGVEYLWNLDGGIYGWQDAGLPIYYSAHNTLSSTGK